MKNKIKGLLALVLSVLIGQAWATDPVATWTDFNTLTSGNYTITKDADGANVISYIYGYNVENNVVSEVYNIADSVSFNDLNPTEA